VVLRLPHFLRALRIANVPVSTIAIIQFDGPDEDATGKSLYVNVGDAVFRHHFHLFLGRIAAPRALYAREPKGVAAQESGDVETSSSAQPNDA